MTPTRGESCENEFEKERERVRAVFGKAQALVCILLKKKRAGPSPLSVKRGQK